MSLYPPPQVMTAEVFTRVPDTFRKKGGKTEWADVMPGGKPPHSFLEGPSFDKEGNLYVVDIPWGRIFRISPKGEWTLVIEYDGEPNGLKIHKDGRIFVADQKNGILLLDPKAGKVEPFVQRRHRERFKGPNDLFFTKTGDLWFTDQGPTGLHDPTGSVFRYSVDGELVEILDNVPSPNGLVMNVAETQLLLAVTRANNVWKLVLHDDGTVYKAGTFIQLSGGNGPDGMALDEKGGLALAHVANGCVFVFDDRGRPQYRVDSPEGVLVTNLAYGGPDRRTLYITESESGSILRATLPTPGKVMYSHQ
jgi:gluconolactonase